MRIKSLQCVAVLVCGLAASAASAQPIELTWSSLDGGVQTSSGGTFELSGTIGQWDAGRRLAQGNLTLAGGFWAPGIVTPDCYGDVNDDGVVDFDDFLAFFNEFDNEGFGSDVNLDGVVNFDDFLAFFNAFDVMC
jgi:hypothetical protein